MGQRTIRLILIAVVALALAEGARFALWDWGPGRSFDGSTSGVWTALAVDVANGVFYRPVLAGDGYGGTRYFPLFFALYGALIALFGHPTAVGLALMQGSVLVMAAAIAALLIRRGVAPGLAVPVALLTYATSVWQQYLTDVNTDYFAAALSLWGLALYGDPAGRGTPTRRGIAMALFLAAFFAKYTALYAPGALFLSMLFHGRLRAAARFAAILIGPAVVIGLGLNAVSGGRMAENFAAAAAAGTGIGHALGFPVWFAREIFVYNPAIGITFALAVWACARGRAGQWRDPVPLMFVLVTLATMAVFTSRGIGGNHAIPLHAVSLVVAGGLLAGGARDRLAFGAAALALGALLAGAWLPFFNPPIRAAQARNNPTLAEIRAFHDRHIPPGAVYLSVQPMLPIAAGRRPFLLDDFNLANFIAEGHPVGRDFAARVEARAFDALLVRSATSLPAPPDPAPGGFAGDLRPFYREAAWLGPYLLMLPKAR